MAAIDANNMLGFYSGANAEATITTQELMVSGLRTVEDVEDKIGVPLIAAIPHVRKNNRPADLLIDKPTSQFAEALRNAADDLALDQHRVDRLADVLRGADPHHARQAEVDVD